MKTVTLVADQSISKTTGLLTGSWYAVVKTLTKMGASEPVNRVMDTSLMHVGRDALSALMPQKSYCSTNCLKSQKHTEHRRLLHNCKTVTRPC